MPHDPEPDLSTPGLAAGPGPTPPGISDGVPATHPVAPEDAGAADEQREQGEAAERSAGTRTADVDEQAGERGPGRDQPGG